MGRKKVFPPEIRELNGTARVSHNRVWHYLGPIGSEEAKLKYAQLILQWAADPNSGRLKADDYLIAELFADYLERGKAKSVYRERHAARIFCGRYGVMPVHEFRALHLEEYKTWLCSEVDVSGKTRWNATSVKQFIQVVRRAWEWGIVWGKTTATQLVELRVVKLPTAGEVRRKKVVSPAHRDTLAKLLPALPQPVRDLVHVIAETGMRPGEVCRLTPAQITRGGTADVPGRGREELGELWMATLEKHKTAGTIGAKYVLLNPTVRGILEALWDERRSDEAFFRPKDSPRTGRRRRVPFFAPNTVYHAVLRACDRAGIEAVTPYQFRHLKAVTLDEEHGRDVARAVLGHTSEHMTSHYTGRNFAAAKRGAGG